METPALSTEEIERLDALFAGLMRAIMEPYHVAAKTKTDRELSDLILGGAGELIGQHQPPFSKEKAKELLWTANAVKILTDEAKRRALEA